MCLHEKSICSECKTRQFLLPSPNISEIYRNRAKKDINGRYTSILFCTENIVTSRAKPVVNRFSISKAIWTTYLKFIPVYTRKYIRCVWRTIICVCVCVLINRDNLYARFMWRTAASTFCVFDAAAPYTLIRWYCVEKIMCVRVRACACVCVRMNVKKAIR